MIPNTKYALLWIAKDLKKMYRSHILYNFEKLISLQIITFWPFLAFLNLNANRLGILLRIKQGVNFHILTIFCIASAKIQIYFWAESENFRNDFETGNLELLGAPLGNRDIWLGRRKADFAFDSYSICFLRFLILAFKCVHSVRFAFRSIGPIRRA